jgi:hypothetical protein
MYRLILLGALALNIDGCHFKDEPDSPLEQVSQQQPVPQNESDCLAADGRWALGGLSRQELCFLPNSDAGKACTKASDCEGVCLAETKTCAPERPLFGCYSYLGKDGAQGMICRD